MGLNEMLMELKLTMKMIAIISILIAATARTASAQANPPGCQSHCGNITIPYPFGSAADHSSCNISQYFFIRCNSTSKPPKAYYMSNSDVEVLDVSLDGHLRILLWVSYDCYDSNASLVDTYTYSRITQSKFRISNSRNKFTVIGCDTSATIGYMDQKRRYATGCMSFCSDISEVINGACSGIGCCQTEIPRGLSNYNISISSINNHTGVSSFNPCGYAFIAEDGYYTFSTSDLRDLDHKKRVPMIMDWTIGNQNCSEAIKDPINYACKDQKSVCFDPETGPGYLCKCRVGFAGNPYLSNGCQDIDECESPKLNDCEGICVNQPGYYTCSCPVSYDGDGRKNGTGCRPTGVHNNQQKVIIVAIGICSGLGFLCLLLAVWWLYRVLESRKRMKLRQKFFKRNGGLLLLKKSSDEGGVEKTKLFTSDELEAATDKFNENRILGRGGQGTVYKGMLQDGKIVAVKKSKRVNEALLEPFINEIVILSQIDHRNVVKLLGCCLETQVPLLVYEFIPNGTLHHLIHDPSEEYPRSWDIRLRRATEVAGAISYLHSAASVPIYHRDIKSSNILLDEKLRAKVSDFGTSKSIDIDQTHLTTQVKGTFGYIDPEYFRSSRFTDKSDVYSFGVVLVELLTGKKPISSFGSDENESLVAHFISSLEENNLVDIIDVQVLKECANEELMAVSYLAKRCLSLGGRNRPTMKEVAMELERFRFAQPKDVGMDETEEPIEPWDSSSTSTRSLSKSDGNTNSL